MGFMDRVARLLGSSAGEQPNDAGTTTVYYVHDNLTSSTFSLSPEEMYETQPYLRSVVDFLSRNTASAPLKCYLREEDNDRKRDTESTLYLLLKYPNNSMTTYELIDRLEHDRKLHGWALWYVVRSTKTVSGWEITPIPVSWVEKTPTRDGFDPSSYKIYNPITRKRAELPAEDCIRFADYNPSNPSGSISPVEALNEILKEQASALKFRNSVWKNGGKVTQYITRPTDAPEWAENGGRDRFVKSWKAKYADGEQSGGTVLLEDGMELKSTSFNAKDTEWAESIKLSRQDVAGVYHVNPALIWAGEGQTYASVKDNARSLYVDTLGPEFSYIAERINAFLLPKIGAPANAYVEFDISVKLAGSFEEQATVLSQSVGAPWMTRDEARGRMNMPKLRDGQGEDVITPLNVVSGGQANPHDTDTSKLPDYGKSATTEISSKGDDVAKKADEIETSDDKTVELKGAATVEEAEDVIGVFRSFFQRQEKSVTSAIDRARDKGTLDEKKAAYADWGEVPSWFDAARWVSELEADLGQKLSSMSRSIVTDALFSLVGNDDDMSEEYIQAKIDEWAHEIAVLTNENTLEDLKRVVYGDVTEGATKSTVHGVFDNAINNRATSTGTTLATQTKSWSNLAAVHLSGTQHSCFKVWRTGSNPRPEHAKMNGETVRYANPRWNPDDPNNYDEHGRTLPGFGEHNYFSNGCRFPGDYNRDVKQVAGCNCSMDIINGGA